MRRQANVVFWSFQLLMVMFVIFCFTKAIRADNASESEPQTCCDVVVDAITPPPNEIIAPPGAPVITEPTMAIIISQAEALVGRPLTRDEETILEFGVGEGAGIGYSQGFGVGLWWVAKAVCSGGGPFDPPCFTID